MNIDNLTTTNRKRDGKQMSLHAMLHVWRRFKR